MSCQCCRLRQPKAVDPVTGVSARVCAKCTHHQGEQEAKRLKRAESHEEMLRQRLDACRSSEQKALRAVADAQENANEAGARMVAALQSRGRLAARIVNAADPAEVQAIQRDPRVIQWANRAEQDDESHFLFDR